MSDNIKFPKRNEDGSFCILACFSVNAENPDDLSERIRDWLVKWAENNQVWTWKYEGGGEDVFLFGDEFKSIPTPVFIDKKELKIKLEGQPTSRKFWKDWLALRIVPELTANFPEIEKLLYVLDCDLTV